MRCAKRPPIGTTTSSRWVIPAPSTRDGIRAEPGNLGRRLGRVRLREDVREAGPNRQRRRDAGARRLRWRPHALSGARHGSRHDARHRARGHPARARLPAVYVEGDMARAPRRATASRHTASRNGGGRSHRSHRDAARSVRGRLRRARRRQRLRTSSSCRRRRGAAATTTRSREGSGCGKRWWNRTIAAGRRGE